jgi:hypothetical protein
MCNFVLKFVAGLFPQKTHLKLYRFSTFDLRRRETFLEFSFEYSVFPFFYSYENYIVIEPDKIIS